MKRQRVLLRHLTKGIKPTLELQNKRRKLPSGGIQYLDGAIMATPNFIEEP